MRNRCACGVQLYDTGDMDGCDACKRREEQKKHQIETDLVRRFSRRWWTLMKEYHETAREFIEQIQTCSCPEDVYDAVYAVLDRPMGGKEDV